jgi:DNA-binding NtrC family response regulator
MSYSDPTRSKRRAFKVPCDLNLVLECVERELIAKALSRTEGSKKAAAVLLGINRTALVEKCRRLGFVVHPKGSNRYTSKRNHGSTALEY